MRTLATGSDEHISTCTWMGFVTLSGSEGTYLALFLPKELFPCGSNDHLTRNAYCTSVQRCEICLRMQTSHCNAFVFKNYSPRLLFVGRTSQHQDTIKISQLLLRYQVDLALKPYKIKIWADHGRDVLSCLPLAVVLLWPALILSSRAFSQSTIPSVLHF